MKYAIQKKMHFIANVLELILGTILILYIIFGIVSLLSNLQCTQMWNGLNCQDFTMNILELVIVVEFIKLIFSHNMDATIELITMAIVRHMIVYHLAPLEMLLSVLSIAILFVIRKYLFQMKIDSTSIQNTDHDSIIQI